MPDKILIIDDEDELLLALARYFKRQGVSVHTATSAQEGWRHIDETMYDLIISDLAMPGMSGLELLEKVRAVDHLTPFIVMTGVGTIETAVEAIKHGAYHYIAKPFKTQELELLARRAIEHGKLHRRLASVNQQSATENPSEMILGTNRSVKEVMQTIAKISQSTASVLIQGETGTGKSMFARYIHETSERRNHPFYTIDCGALTENLLESELFGHVKGAFTGAICAKRGLLEEAQGGTIFLDEIGELTPSTQVKLLRAIQELEIKPVGGNKPVKIDVRFISATSRDLNTEVKEQRFRKDLYFRLAVIPLKLPPLRERKEDLLLFINYFVHKLGSRYNKRITEIAPCALTVLMESPWRGNIRELENVLERAVLLASGPTITVDTLFSQAEQRFEEEEDRTPVPLKDAVELAEKQAIRQALLIAAGNRTKAAQYLGIGRRTLYDKMDAYSMNE
jgi:DNA-binding NtrC family response regulator